MQKRTPDEKKEIEKIKDILKSLCHLRLPSAHGGEGGAELIGYLSVMFDDLKCDRMGNIILSFGDGGKRIMADAHYDEVSLAVSDITESGFLKVVSPFGADIRTLPASKVTILGKEPVTGVVFAVPPHLSDGKRDELKASEFFVDIGRSAEEAKKLVSPGAAVVYERTFSELSGYRVASNSLDNRISLAALVYLALMLREAPPTDRTIDIVFSYGEENGMNGAKTAAYGKDYRAALILDGTFGLSPGLENDEAKPLGEGPCIGVSPLLDRRLSEFLINKAEEKELPYNIEVMPGSTGTNSMAYFISGGGIPCAMLSAPVRYMHTPAETADLRDILVSSRLAYEFLIGVDGGEADGL